MNVASLELCKELYNRSGWKETDYFYQFIEYSDLSTGYHLMNPVLEIPLHANAYPAYDLSYLLQKLYACGPVLRLDLEARPDAGQGKYFIWIFQENIDIRLWANTPEDAACKLAIQLFQQGILKRD